MVVMQASKKLDKFFAKFKLLEYRKGETIIRAEDQPQGAYFLKSGYVRMSVVSVNGGELTLNIFKPGSFFPMFWAIAEVKNWYSFQAMSKVEVFRVPKTEVISFLKQDPEVLLDLTKRILIGMDGLLVNMQHLLFGSSHNRIAAAILLSAKRFGQKTGNGQVFIDLELTHQDIAYLAGVARETVSISIKQFENADIIGKLKKHFIVKNIKKLEQEIFVEDAQSDTPVTI